MYPSHAEMMIAPMTGETQIEKSRAYNQSMAEWKEFCQVQTTAAHVGHDAL